MDLTHHVNYSVNMCGSFTLKCSTDGFVTTVFFQYTDTRADINYCRSFNYEYGYFLSEQDLRLNMCEMIQSLNQRHNLNLNSGDYHEVIHQFYRHPVVRRFNFPEESGNQVDLTSITSIKRLYPMRLDNGVQFQLDTSITLTQEDTLQIEFIISLFREKNSKSRQTDPHMKEIDSRSHIEVSRLYPFNIDSRSHIEFRRLYPFNRVDELVAEAIGEIDQLYLVEYLRAAKTLHAVEELLKKVTNETSHHVRVLTQYAKRKYSHDIA